MATDDPNAEIENTSEQSPTAPTATTAVTAATTTKETAKPTESSAEDAAPVVAMSELIQAGVHFGHQTRRWNPKMKRFIHGDVGGIYIIDLKQTLAQIEAAYVFVRNMVADGGTLLFVGTKKQSQESTALHAKRCGMPYVNERWLGGMLTNIETIFKRVHKMQEYQRMQKTGEFDAMPKKEALSLRRELAKLERNLGGIGQMDTPPEAVFVLDTKTDHIAVSEANKLRIPLIAVVDTNCDPDVADYLIPGNDDSIRSGDLMCRVMADAVIAGKRFGRLEEVPHSVSAPEDVSAPLAPTASTADEVSPPPAAATSEPVSSEEPEEPPAQEQGDTPVPAPAPETPSEEVISSTSTPRAPVVEEETDPSLVAGEASIEETAVGGESQPQEAPAFTEEAEEAVGETARAEASEEVAPTAATEEPGEPGEPESPKETGEPESSEGPGESGAPEKPKEPESPEASGEPKSSGEPEAPEAPEEPKKPEPEEEAEKTPASEAARETLEATHERAPEDAPAAEVDTDSPEAEPEAPADREAVAVPEAVPEEDGAHESEEDKEEKMEKKSMRWFRKRRSADNL